MLTIKDSGGSDDGGGGGGGVGDGGGDGTVSPHAEWAESVATQGREKRGTTPPKIDYRRARFDGGVDGGGCSGGGGGEGLESGCDLDGVV